MPIAGEFLAKLGNTATITVSDGTSARVALPESTRGYHITAIGTPMWVNLGDGSVSADANNRKLHLTVDESKEFQGLIESQTHIAAAGDGGAGTLLITGLDN